ncbi:NAD-binding protein [Streptomyces sp. NPDC056704]|uniref:NAD-binding protein n=1 Tax=Streptomyces sp. NPDC056704 TaxID=3345917 RepID=UPI0036D1B189
MDKRDAYLYRDETRVAFTLQLVGKDLDFILALAERVGAPMRQAETNRALVRDAGQAGYAERDLSAMAGRVGRVRGGAPSLRAPPTHLVPETAVGTPSANCLSA